MAVEKVKKQDVIATWLRYGMAGAIGKYREDNAWTQDELVEKLNQQGFKCSRSYVSTVEAGHNEPSYEMLQAFERVFNMESGSLTLWGWLVPVMKYAEKHDITIVQAIGEMETAEADKQIREELGHHEIERRAAEHGLHWFTYRHILASARRTPPEKIQPFIDAFLQSVQRTKEAKQRRREERRRTRR